MHFLKAIYVFMLSVRQFVCAHSSFHMHSSNFLKLLYINQVLCEIFRIENGEYRTNSSYTGTHKIIPIYYNQRVKLF